MLLGILAEYVFIYFKIGFLSLSLISYFSLVLFPPINQFVFDWFCDIFEALYHLFNNLNCYHWFCYCALSSNTKNLYIFFSYLNDADKYSFKSGENLLKIIVDEIHCETIVILSSIVVMKKKKIHRLQWAKLFFVVFQILQSCLIWNLFCYLNCDSY